LKPFRKTTKTIEKKKEKKMNHKKFVNKTRENKSICYHQRFLSGKLFQPDEFFAMKAEPNLFLLKINLVTIFRMIYNTFRREERNNQNQCKLDIRNKMFLGSIKITKI
jgi:hypothetical protein